MSTCISRHGEYSSHTWGSEGWCNFCGAYPEIPYTYTCDAGNCNGITIAIIQTQGDPGWISMCRKHARQELRNIADDK